MSLALRISSVFTGVLVTVSVAGRLWLNSIWAAETPEYHGTGVGIFYLWILFTLLIVVPSVLITSVMLVVRWHRKPPNDTTLHR
jgi:hypothetical protein